MAVTLDTTLAGETSNSYVDIDYADAYWGGHYATTKAEQWAALTTDQKSSVLVQACRVIDTARFTELSMYRTDANHMVYDRRQRLVLNLQWQLPPIKYYYYQRLQFPRNIDRQITTGLLYVPEPIKMAQCEQALYLLNFDETVLANRMQGLTHEAMYIGNIHIRQDYTSDGSSFAPMALEYIRPFLLKSSARMRRC